MDFVKRITTQHLEEQFFSMIFKKVCTFTFAVSCSSSFLHQLGHFFVSSSGIDKFQVYQEIELRPLIKDQTKFSWVLMVKLFDIENMNKKYKTTRSLRAPPSCDF